MCDAVTCGSCLKMRSAPQIVFCLALVALSWLAMTALHELGHVLGAIATGGVVQRIVWHPLAISRTDVAPNPRPGVVVWLGPIVGCALPLAVWAAAPKAHVVLRRSCQFFAGFCLIANGAYLALGSFHRIGDCGVMLATGTPRWALLILGGATACLGMFLWHDLGSLRLFLRRPALITAKMAGVAFCLSLALCLLGATLSAR